MFFDDLPVAIPDAILGLNETFRQDTRPGKINLSVGVYKNESGITPILNCVKEAERRLLESETTKSYLAIGGSPQYATAVQELLFAEDGPILADGLASTVHTPGGTGGVRVAADFIKESIPKATVWLSAPTWPNHPAIFATAGLPTETYPYFDPQTNGLDFSGMMQCLRKIPQGDVVLLHGCCHNPTGIDPTREQWEETAAVVRDRGLLPLIDFAYQGLGDGIEEDAAGFRIIAEANKELLIASSFSKNFGLYNERVGALTVVCQNSEDALRAEGQLNARIRPNYSNPPAHGGAIVTTILNDDGLRTQWKDEVREMRERIHRMRNLFVEQLRQAGVARDFSFLARQKGMFSYSGLLPEQVDRLREEFSIYAVRSGRINVAGMTGDNMGRLCQAIAKVLA